MTTPPPVSTFIPQDPWYNLTVGQLVVSVATTIPNVGYLEYNATTQIGGIVGPVDGTVAFLAGTNTELDGGQKWLMWVAASLATPDNINIFCPFVSTSTPGRWISTALSQSLASVQVVTSGTSIAVAPSSAPAVDVIINLTTPAAVTVTLPANPGLGQEFWIKDGSGTSQTYNITVQGVSVKIDGANNFVIASPYGSAVFVWNGTQFNVK